MPDELSELRENAEEGANEPFLKPVSFTMAILAVLVAVVSLLGHRAHTEELLLQSKATDNWSYYQAKSIRSHTYDLFLDMISISTVKDQKLADEVKQKYSKQVARYDREEKEIEEEGHKLEAEVALQQKKGDRFDLGEVFLEVALVVTSITLLTKRKMFWALGLVAAIAGFGIAMTAFRLQ